VRAIARTGGESKITQRVSSALPFCVSPVKRNELRVTCLSAIEFRRTALDGKAKGTTCNTVVYIQHAFAPDINWIIWLQQAGW